MSALQRYQSPMPLAEPARPSSARVRRRSPQQQWPQQPQQRPRQKLQHHQQQKHRAIALEAGVKLAVNSLFALVAVSTVVRLTPEMRSHQKQLKVLNQEVEVMEARVNGLQTNFNRHFDPQQSYRIMQEQSSRIAPSQVQIIWVDSNTQQAATEAPVQHQ